MYTAKSGCKFRPRSGRWPLRFGGDFSYCVREHHSVTSPPLDSPSFCTRTEDACEIGLRQPGEPERAIWIQREALQGFSANP
jgi:hypothetical protein